MNFPILAENPACSSACRACHYKELAYPDQLVRKRRWAERQLGHFGEALREIVPAPESERLGYRARSWLRAHVENGEVSLGMFRAVQGETKWKKEFISWNTCPIHSLAIERTVARLRTALGKRAADFSENSLFGIWFGTPHVVLIAKDHREEELKNLDWNSILEPPLKYASFHQTNQVGRSVFGEGPIHPLNAAPEYPLPIRAFRQVARTLVDRARMEAVHALLAKSPSLVVDLYCGTGELATLLPREVGWVGIESSKEAVAAANRIRPAEGAFHEAYLGLTEDRLRDSQIRRRFSGKYALYLNPPRPGLGEEAREVLIDLVSAHRPSSLVYLSCSASSLARDLDAFTQAGFEVKSLQPFDFFPQTEHFETLAILG